MSRRTVEVTPELLLRAYRVGLFPMAETRRGNRLYWLDPERRGVLPLDRFGESMFSTARDASKVALVHLVARLRLGGYRLLDTQFVTSHLTQFGTEEVPRDRYKALLAGAVDETARWEADSAAVESEIRTMAQ